MAEGANVKQLTAALALGAVLGGSGATLIAKKTDATSVAPPPAPKKTKTKKLDCFGVEVEEGAKACDKSMLPKPVKIDPIKVPKFEAPKK